MSTGGVKILISFVCVVIIVLTGVTFYQLFQEKTREKIIARTFCLLPPPPSNGWYQPKLSPSVPTGTILRVFCRESYILRKENASVCINGNWFPEIGECLQTCPSMYSTSMMTMKCFHNNRLMKNCENAVEGTHVQYFCPLFYEDARLYKFKGICRNGSWSEDPPSCVPVCGRNYKSILTPLIINGTVSTKAEFPWQVAIYYQKVFICGGVLLHEKLILTAAHCCQSKEKNTDQLSKYTVVVGNFYRNYTNVVQEEVAQLSLVENIITYEGFQGEQNAYEGDIAVIIPRKPFKLSVAVRPICIDWDKKYAKDKRMGIVSGWGNTAPTGKPSEHLRKLQVPIIPYEDCEKSLSDVERDYISEDKLCAGYINKSKSACRGDSGGGLIFEHLGVYYLSGIVSVALEALTVTGGCNIQQFTFFTDVSKYLDNFIENYYEKYKPSTPSVYEKPPEHPQVKTTRRTRSTFTTPLPPEKYSFAGNCTPPPIPHGSVETYKSKFFFKVKCESGYKLDGDQIIECENGRWSSPVGQCLKVCPSLINTTFMNISCFYQMGKLKSCNDTVHGSNAHFNCAKFYEKEKMMEHPVFCNNGSWTPGVPKCVPRCGHKVMTDLTNMKNHSDLKKEVFPWVLTIYDEELVCMATLLSERLAVTSRDCLNLNRSYMIVAGQYSPGQETSSLVQRRNISSVDVVIHNYLAFIRFSKEPFHLSAVVQPVCLDWNEKLKDFHLGYISGWNHSVQVSKVGRIDECRKMMPESYVNMTDEKSCIRYESEVSSMLFKNGGGGLFYMKPKNRFFLVGILDVLNSTKIMSKYRTYIPIHDYIDVLQSEVF